MNYDILMLPLGIQASLGAGYLGYVTAYAGLRHEHSARDAAFISLAFSAIALVVFQALADAGSVIAVTSAAVSVLVFAGIWRAIGKRVWLRIMSAAGVHRDDGVHQTWQALVQTRRVVGQVSVHTADGRILYLNDRRQFLGAEWDGLYLGGDGGIVMVVEEEELPDGTEETRTGICDQHGGTRLTYIPASEIRRVNLRLK